MALALGYPSHPQPLEFFRNRWLAKEKHLTHQRKIDSFDTARTLVVYLLTVKTFPSRN
jgi:hypothetical protein